MPGTGRGTRYGQHALNGTGTTAPRFRSPGWYRRTVDRSMPNGTATGCRRDPGVRPLRGMGRAEPRNLRSRLSAPVPGHQPMDRGYEP